MAEKIFKHDINLFGSALINATLNPIASDPGSPTTGQVWYNTTDNRLKVYNGSEIITLVGTNTSDTLTNKTLDANGTGNSLSNVEVADFAASALTSDLSTSALSTQLATADAVKAYTDLIVASGFKYKGVIDASANPNYPAAIIGDLYKISVAGKLGGASGEDVQVGDALYCVVDSVSGDHATVGANFDILQGNIDAATDAVLGLVELATASEAEGNTGNQVLTPANTAILPRYGIKAVTAATTGTITLPTGATAVECFASEAGPPIQRVEISWSVTGTTLTWETTTAITADVIVGYVFGFVALT
jgi:hypothetical protein